MLSFSEALQLVKIGKRDMATTMLREEFGKLQSPEQRVELCKWIAVCFEGLEDYNSAGEWHEMAGFLSLTQTSSDVANAMRALPEYQKARLCYSNCEDDERAGVCATMIDQLNHAFAAA